MMHMISSGTLCFSMILFFIMLFGNENNLVQKWKLRNKWTLKTVFAFVIGTSAWNTWNTNHYWGEVLMNFSLAALFVWAFYFHRYMLYGNK